MEMKRCERGHYYDASVHGSCPYCRDVNDTDKTVAMGVENTMTMTSAQSLIQEDVSTPLVAPNFTAPVVGVGEERTVAIFRTDQGVDPVVGWLVCIDGKEKGKDYRIHSDNNYVGRSEKMDICIRNDDTISREKQAVLTYDSGDKCFYISPGEGRSIIRLNGKAIFQTAELHAYDRVIIGKTELIFLPFCGEDFAWED